MFNLPSSVRLCTDSDNYFRYAIYICVYIYLYLYLSIYIYIYNIYMCIYIYIYIYIYVIYIIMYNIYCRPGTRNCLMELQTCQNSHNSFDVFRSECNEGFISLILIGSSKKIMFQFLWWLVMCVLFWTKSVFILFLNFITDINCGL